MANPAAWSHRFSNRQLSGLPGLGPTFRVAPSAMYDARRARSKSPQASTKSVANSSAWVGTSTGGAGSMSVASRVPCHQTTAATTAAAATSPAAAQPARGLAGGLAVEDLELGLGIGLVHRVLRVCVERRGEQALDL